MAASRPNARKLVVMTVVAVATAAWGVDERAAPAEASLSFTRVVVDATLPGFLDNKAVGDLDGDGLPDIVIGTDTQLVWYEAPAWTRRTIATGHNFTTDMQAADVDADGDVDVVTPHFDTGAVAWYRNPLVGGGSWAPVEMSTPGPLHDLEVGDLDADGRVDVVGRGHGGPTVLFRQASPVVWTTVVIPAAPPGEGTALGDVDRDGRLDIVQSGYWLAAPADVTDGPAWVRHTFAPGWDDGYVGVAVGDLNGDGRLDVTLARSESEGRMAWYEAPADPRAGGWAEHRIDDDLDFAHTFKAADMDADGDLDVVFAEMQQSLRRRVGIWVNGGAGTTWTYHGLSTDGSHNLRVADIGADGDLDVVGANWQGGPVELWENGGVTAPPTTTTTTTTTTAPTTSTTTAPPTSTTTTTTAAPTTTTTTSTTTTTTTVPGTTTRVTSGLTALYRFDAGAGSVVADVSGVGAPLDLAVVDPAAVRWVSGGGLAIERAGGALRSQGPAGKVLSAATASGGVTLEAWVTPADLGQSGPARVATLSSGTSQTQVNVHLGQSGTAGSSRLRTTATPFSWIQPSGVFSSTTQPVHLATTFDGSVQRVFVNGVAHPLTATPGGTLGSWDPSYPLVVGDEATLDRPWLGTVYLVAAYGRALSAAEVARNFEAGRPGGSSPPPTTTTTTTRPPTTTTTTLPPTTTTTTLPPTSTTTTQPPATTTTQPPTSTTTTTQPPPTSTTTTQPPTSTTTTTQPPPTTTTTTTTAPPASRVTSDLVALYPFDEGTGATVRDTSGAGSPLDLTIVDPGKVRWVPGGLRFVRSGGAARSAGPATKVTSAARSSGAVTLEAWVTPANLTQNGPARIATVSSGTSVGQVDVHLGQSGRSGSARLRTTVERFSWIQPSEVFRSTATATHVVTTFDGTTQRVYVDGAAHPLTATPGGTLANWDTSYPLIVGNEAGLNRSWLGTVGLVAVYSRALSAAEVQRNFAVGPSG